MTGGNGFLIGEVYFSWFDRIARDLANILIDSSWNPVTSYLGFTSSFSPWEKYESVFSSTALVSSQVDFFGLVSQQV